MDMARMMWGIKPVVAGLALLATALPAQAGGSFGFAFSFSKGHRHHGVAVGGSVVVAPTPVVAPAPVLVPAPVVVERPVVVAPPPRVWVPPVYKTVVERVWVPTVTTAYRDVPVFDVFGNVVSYRREPYTVHGGYWKEVPRQVLVRPGYWTVGEPAPPPPLGTVSEPAPSPARRPPDVVSHTETYRAREYELESAYEEQLE